MIKRLKRFSPVLIVIVFLVTLGYPVFVSAQANFSGNNPESYECFDRSGSSLESDPIKDDVSGAMYCEMNGQAGYQPCVGGVYDQGSSCDPAAVLKPVPLNQLEIWFVRVVYAIWSIAVIFSVLGIFVIGYQYMVSRGAPEAMAKVKDRIAKFIIGFCLIFLAVPILNTIFRLLAVNDSVECYQGLTGGGNNVGIGFQFIFPDLCTAPNLEGGNVSPSQVCSELQRMVSDGRVTISSVVTRRTTGLACSSPGQTTSTCGLSAGPINVGIAFTCEAGTWTPRINQNILDLIRNQ
jgi:hypothetical protein